MAKEYYSYIKDSGIIVPDTSSIEQDVLDIWQSKEVFGGDLSPDPSTPQGRLMETQVLTRLFAIGMSAAVANQINPNVATGQFLDGIAALFGLARTGASRTRVIADISGVPGTVIPAGSLAKTQDGDTFYAENDVTIESSGSISGYFLSQETGAIPCPVGSLTRIISATEGWETINNGSPGILGAEVQSDYSLRNYIEDSRYQGVSLVGDVQSALNNVPNILSNFVYNNGTNETVVYRGASVLPHSLLIMVDGGEDQAIALAIFKKRSAGCNLTPINPDPENPVIPGVETVVEPVIDGAYNVAYPITFNRPARREIYVDITVRNNGYSGDDLETAIKNAIVDWSTGNVVGLAAPGIGDSISSFQISSIVTSQIPTVYVSGVLIGLSPNPTSSAEINFNIYEIAAFNADNIKVIIST